jgi:hypothetical protein
MHTPGALRTSGGGSNLASTSWTLGASHASFSATGSTADENGHYHGPFRPGWALVGDADCLKDPSLGQGINDAFPGRGVHRRCHQAGWSGRQPLQASLAAAQKRRDDETGMIYAPNDPFASGNTTRKLVEMLFQAWRCSSRRRLLPPPAGDHRAGV